MKIRNGFVSNSSSSSFCIYGAQAKITPDNLALIKKHMPEQFQKGLDRIKTNRNSLWMKPYISLLENIGNEEFFADIKKRGCSHEESVGAKFCPECGKPTWITEINPNKTKMDDMDQETLALFIGLEYHCGPEGEGCIGRSWDSINDNETGADFKKSVNDVLRILNGTECGATIEECWYDG